MFKIQIRIILKVIDTILKQKPFETISLCEIQLKDLHIVYRLLYNITFVSDFEL